MAAFGGIFTYTTVDHGEARVKYSGCKLLQDKGDYPAGAVMDQIWFDLMTGELWFVPDTKCNWDISDNFPVSL